MSGHCKEFVNLVESVHLQMGESKSLCRVLATQMGRKILDIFGVELCVFPKSYVRNGSQLPMLLGSHSRRVLSGGPYQRSRTLDGQRLYIAFEYSP